MAYNTSKASIDKVRKHLVDMRGELVRLPTSNPQKLAYELREGIAAAKKQNDPDYPTFRYMLRVGVNEVVCIPIEFRNLTRNEPRNVFQIIQSIMNDPIIDRTLFSSAVVRDGEMQGITKWLDGQNLELIKSDGNVYVQPKGKANEG